VHLLKASQDVCAAALRKCGFTAKLRGSLLQPRADDAVTGWLALRFATSGLPAEVRANPVVGVRHIRVEKAFIELLGGDAPIPTLSLPLRDLIPRRTVVRWDFRAGTDLNATAKGLARNVGDYGLPFIDRWADWRVLSRDIEQSGLIVDCDSWSPLPIILALAGNHSRARQLVDERLVRYAGRSHVYAAAYREFAAKFSTWISTQ
jgi:hypothetical protein